MVGTRNSLPNLSANNQDADDEHVPKELRNLQINAKDTLYGGKKEEPAVVATYRYRGVAYLKTADTPQEWLNQGPARYKGRLKKEAEEEQTEASKSTSKDSKRTLKRKSTSDAHDNTPSTRDRHTSAEDQPRPAKRARRLTAPQVSAEPAPQRRKRASIAPSTTPRLPSTTTLSKPRIPSTAERRRRQSAAAASSLRRKSSTVATSLRRRSTAAASSSRRKSAPAASSSRHKSAPTASPSRSRKRVPTASYSMSRKPSTTASPTKATIPAAVEMDDEDDLSLRFAYSSTKTQSLLDEIEAARKEARDKGYCVSPSAITAPDEQREKDFGQYQKTLSARLARDISKIAKLNTKIGRLSAEYSRMKGTGVFEAILGLKSQRPGSSTSEKVAAQLHEQLNVVGPGVSEDIQYDPPSDDVHGDDVRLAVTAVEAEDAEDAQSDNDDTPILVSSENMLQALSIPETDPTTLNSHSSSSMSDLSERNSSPRHDSATSGTSPDLVPSEPEHVVTRSKVSPDRQPETLSLPRTNRGGQTLRWSLSGDRMQGIRKDTGNGRQDGRAEGMIHRGRLNGESKSARRRRVQREMKFLQSWPVDKAESEME